MPCDYHTYQPVGPSFPWGHISQRCHPYMVVRDAMACTRVQSDAWLTCSRDFIRQGNSTTLCASKPLYSRGYVNNVSKTRAQAISCSPKWRHPLTR